MDKHKNWRACETGETGATVAYTLYCLCANIERKLERIKINNNNKYARLGQFAFGIASDLVTMIIVVAAALVSLTTECCVDGGELNQCSWHHNIVHFGTTLLCIIIVLIAHTHNLYTYCM